MATIQVKVKPNARISRLTPPAGEGDQLAWAAELRSPPVDGRANEELIALVAAHFACRKSAVTIRGGSTGRMKWVRVDER